MGDTGYFRRIFCAVLLVVSGAGAGAAASQQNLRPDLSFEAPSFRISTLSDGFYPALYSQHDNLSSGGFALNFDDGQMFGRLGLIYRDVRVSDFRDLSAARNVTGGVDHSFQELRATGFDLSLGYDLGQGLRLQGGYRWSQVELNNNSFTRASAPVKLSYDAGGRVSLWAEASFDMSSSGDISGYRSADDQHIYRIGLSMSY